MSKTLKIFLIVIGVIVLSVSAVYAGWALAGSWQPRTTFLNSRQYHGQGPAGKMGIGYGKDGGMMGNRSGFGSRTGSTPLTVSQAESAAKTYLNSMNLHDLAIAEVMIFDNNAYVRVVEKSTGMGAFELLVDPVTFAVYPEPGPNMMWNLKYGGINHTGMMGGGSYGMMNSYRGNGTITDVSPEMTVTAAQALQLAKTYLDTYLHGTSTAFDADSFYGYYTIDVLNGGNIIGMLSVNGFSGQVFYHTWHGKFIDVSEGK